MNINVLKWNYRMKSEQTEKQTEDGKVMENNTVVASTKNV